MQPLPENLSNLTTIRLRPGTHRMLEDFADEMLRVALKDLPPRAKMDILTPWKQKDRLNKEVYNPSGVATDARRGIYGRVLNRRQPHLNARDGSMPARRGLDGLRTLVETDAVGEDITRTYFWENQEDQE